MPIPTSLPPISTLPSLPNSTHVSILTTLFEPSANLQQLILPLLSSTWFDSYTDLIAAIGIQLTSLAESSSPSDTTSLDRILNAHPRLGEKNLKSVQSSGEQASLRGNQHDDEELSELNERYERAFPGLRYVVFVNGRDQRVILNDIRLRIERRDIQMERQDAIKAMCDIAADRAEKLSME